MTFDADAGIRYWNGMRIRAQNNEWANDSVFVQFSGSVDDKSSPLYRIGMTAATSVNLEDCSNCGISGWGGRTTGMRGWVP